MLSWDVDGRTKVAVIARDGVRDYEHHRGWGVETWAECDPAEFPSQTTDALGIGVWHDEHGMRVRVARIESFPHDEFCDYDGIDYLQIGRGRTAQFYIRDPGGQLTKYVRVPYAVMATLPATAIDSGFHREGRELWYPAQREAVYLVARGSASDIQRWPAFKKTFGCG